MKAAELREFMAALDPESVPSIEQARDIVAERDRRAREIAESRSESIVEAGYSHGDGYVSQSRAALRDHRRRQRAADDLTEREDDGKPEMSEARRRRLDRLASASKIVEQTREPTENDPDKQREAPGGGHTRSR